MSSLLFRRLAFRSESYQQAFALRDAVLRKPLGRSLYGEPFAQESSCIHFGAFWDGLLVGAACFWVQEDQTAVFKHLAVSQQAQGKGVGRGLLAVSEQEMRQLKVKKCLLKARVCALPFYQKNGYHPTGDPLPGQPPHQIMLKYFKE